MKHELYNKHRKQLVGLANKVARTWGGALRDDLQSEAYLYFCKALETYDPSKAAFSTHLYLTVLGNLTHICRRAVREASRSYSLDVLPEPKAQYADFCRALEQREILARLSPDATKLLHNMLNSNITASQPGRKISCRYVCDTFGKSIGWTRDYTERVWVELGRAYEAMAV